MLSTRCSFPPPLPAGRLLLWLCSWLWPCLHLPRGKANPANFSRDKRAWNSKCLSAGARGLDPTRSCSSGQGGRLQPSRAASASPCPGARSSAGVAQLLSRGRAGVAASVCVLSGVCWVAVFSRFVFVFFCEFLKSCFLFLAKRSLVHPLQAGITACSRSVPAGSRFGGCSGSCYCSWWESA